jgi:hypothetical protein
MEKVVQLERDDSTRRPTISLALLAKMDDADDHLDLRSTLTDLSLHVDEIVVVAYSHRGDPRPMVMEACNLVPMTSGRVHSVVCTSPELNPELYDVDCPETFRRGRPLAGEVYAGESPGEKFVACRSRLRNLALSRCSMEWRISLTSREILHHPDCLRSLCRQLDESCRDVAYGSHHRGPRQTQVAKLSRNVPSIRYEGCARESLEGGLRPAIVENSLRTDERSDPSQDRVAFRALYAEARRLDWEIPICNLVHLARTSTPDQREFALSCIRCYLDGSLYPEERAWAAALRGEIHEAREELEEATQWYEASLAEHPGWKSALRLARVHFLRKSWQRCVEAYDRATQNLRESPAAHLCDDGSEQIATSLIHVAYAYHALERTDDCQRICRTLRELFPLSQAILSFCSSLEK